MQRFTLTIILASLGACMTTLDVPGSSENDDPTFADSDGSSFSVADENVRDDTVEPDADPDVPPPASSTFTVYMSTTGKDTNSGLTAALPVKSLARVQSILQAAKPTSNVEIRIKPGTYVAEPLTWRFYIPGHSVTFLPEDYHYNAYHEALPMFQDAMCGSTRCGGYWLHVALPTNHSDPLYNGGTTDVRFYLLQVEYYSSGGIAIDGDTGRTYKDNHYNPPVRIQGSKGLNGNTFYGMHFTHIGNHWSGGSYGWGGIVLTNSSNNNISHCSFTNIENNGGADGYGGYIHGVYITHFSSSNYVGYNSFSDVSSDEVKLRDRSNNNNIEHNTSSHSGVNSHYREEYCDEECAVSVGHGQERQCASYQNRFADNKLDDGYYSGGPIPTWSLNPSGQTNAGGAPCSIPHGDQRLATAGNSGD
jgi:hypothetical protein